MFDLLSLVTFSHLGCLLCSNKFLLSLYISVMTVDDLVCVCVFMCVCVWERERSECVLWILPQGKCCSQALSAFLPLIPDLLFGPFYLSFLPTHTRPHTCTPACALARSHTLMHACIQTHIKWHITLIQHETLKVVESAAGVVVHPSIHPSRSSGVVGGEVSGLRIVQD